MNDTSGFTMRQILERRIRARRQILFSKEDPCISNLQSLIDARSRRVVVSWALELAEETAVLLEQKYPADLQARQALELTRLWARGEVKMPIAKSAILACHAAAKEITDPGDIARFHAVGQACGTVHANGHAMGYPIYDLTALIRETEKAGWDDAIRLRVIHYIDRLAYWDTHITEDDRKWAAFLR